MHIKICAASVSLQLFFGGISVFIHKIGKERGEKSFPRSVGGRLSKSTAFRNGVKAHWSLLEAPVCLLVHLLRPCLCLLLKTFAESSASSLDIKI